MFAQLAQTTNLREHLKSPYHQNKLLPNYSNRTTHPLVLSDKRTGHKSKPVTSLKPYHFSLFSGLNCVTDC